MFGRTRPFEPPVEELSAQSQGFSPGYEPSARNVLRVKPGYPTPLVESADVAADRVRAHMLDAYKALDKFVSYLIGQGFAPKTVVTYVTTTSEFFNYEEIDVDPYNIRTRVEPFSARPELPPVSAAR